MPPESAVEGVDPGLAGGGLEMAVGGQGSRQVAIAERDGGEGRMTVNEGDGDGRRM